MSHSAGAPGPTDGDLVVTVEDEVATLWLNRPDKRNAVTHAMWLEITAACARLADDAEVRLLVLRGVGPHFCAGADVGDLVGVDPDLYQEANEAADRALAAFPKPSLAVVTGACVGGGTELAVACDLRLADASARFGITPARLGIVYPAPATERVVRAIGPSATKHLLFTAELIDAERALRIGLVDELWAPADLDARVGSLVDLLAHRRSLLTQMASKEIVAAAELGPVPAEVSARWAAARANALDPVEGITAFLEGRDPDFAWRPGA